MKIRFAVAFLILALALTVAPVRGAQPLPLTNADVVKMVQGHLGPETIVTAIQSEKHNFDLSSNGLIALKRAGVPEDVIRAMLNADAAPAAAQTQAQPVVGEAVVSLLDGSAQKPLQGSVAQAISAPGKAPLIDVNSTIMQTAAAESMNVLHGPFTGLFGGLVDGLIGMFDRPSANGGVVHAQWAIANAYSSTIVSNATPAFDVQYQAADVNALQVAIVRLVPNTQNARIVRLDTVVPTHVAPLGPGHVRLSTDSPLQRGEYGVIVSHVPNVVWDFSIH